VVGITSSLVVNPIAGVSVSVPMISGSLRLRPSDR